MEGGDAAEQTSNSAASIEESPADENTPLHGKRLSNRCSILPCTIFRHPRGIF